MNFRTTCVLIALTLVVAFAPITVTYAQCSVPAGCTGLGSVPTGAFLAGSTQFKLQATTSPTVGYITATSGTSTLPKLSISSALYLLGDYITNVSTWFATHADTWLTGKTTDQLAEGVTNLYYTPARVTALLNATTTTGFSTTSASYFASKGLAYSTTSTAYDLSTYPKGYFFSTTSVAYWESTQSRWATTSTDYWKTVNNFFSTTSAAYFLAQNQSSAFSTTSNDFWQSQRNFFSTTSAAYFSGAGLAFSTTSSDYWLTTKSLSAFSTTSANYWASLGLAFSTTSTNYLLNSTTSTGFSTTSANYWKSTNNFFSTTSASYFTGVGLGFSTTSSDYWGGTKGYLTANQNITLSGDVTGSGATAITTTIAPTVTHWWTALQNTTNASTSQLTATSSVWLTSLATPAGTFLAVDNTGKIIATSTPNVSATFSTTSASYFSSVGLAFSTTSSDYWKTQRDFFSTTSASYFLSQNQAQAFSTTSASFFSSVGLTFSTTSANFWSSVGLGHSTTSVAYQLSQNVTIGNATSTTLSTGTASSTNLTVSALRSGLIAAGTIGNTYTAATTTGSCSGTVSCSSFVILGSSPITITGSAGTSASSTLYADIGTWTGTQNFAKLTFTNATGTTLSLSTASTSDLFVSNLSNVLLSTAANGKLQSTSFSGPLSYNGGTLSLSQSNSGTNGYLSSTDWQRFNAALSTTTVLQIGNGQFFSTTSSSYFSSVGLSFSTTSANFWSSVGLGHSTTSVAYQLTQNVSLGNATSTTFFSTTASSTNLFATNASTTNLSIANNASTTNLWISAIRNGLLATNGQGNVVASSTPTALSFVSTGSTASRFPYASTTALTVSGSLYGAGLSDCNGSANKVIYTASTGQFGCAADQTGAGGGVWPFTVTDTNFNVAVQSTTTPEWFKTGVFASSTSQFLNLNVFGMLGVGSSTPWAGVSIVGSGPLFATATSSGASPLFMISASTTMRTKDWARVTIGTTTESLTGQTWPLFVQGEIYSTKRYFACEEFGDFFGLTADALGKACGTGSWSFDEDNQGAVTSLSGLSAYETNGTRFVEIWSGATAGATALTSVGDGAAIILNDASGIGSASSSPRFEAQVFPVPTNATNTVFSLGISGATVGSNWGFNSNTLDSNNGYYFAATSSPTGEWYAYAKEIGATVQVAPTGVASTTPGVYRVFRIDVVPTANGTGTTAYYYIDDILVAKLSLSGITNKYIGLIPYVAVGNASNGSAGLAKAMRVSYIRTWADLVPGR